MNKLILTLKDQPNVPLEAENIVPDQFVGLTNAAVRAIPIFLGKKQCRLDDFFTVEGDGSDDVELRGDLKNVKWLGKGMKSGILRASGNVGMHLGAYMKGGTIEVAGNASDWVGAEMTNGTIRVAGDAGGQLGGAYRGSLSGMNGGIIVIGGTGQLEIGIRMKRGVIVIGGRVRDFAGLQMKGGTLFLLQGAEIRTGAWMNRGTIVSLKPLKLLPTFTQTCSYNPTFLRLYAKRLASFGVSIPVDAAGGSYQRYVGDSAIPGKGEILVWQPSA